MSSDPDRLTLDHILRLLADSRRRVVLTLLQEHGSLRLPDLAEEVVRIETDTSIPELTEEEITRVYMELWHVHIPKLAEADVIEYDQQHDVVLLGDSIEEVAKFLPTDDRDDRDGRDGTRGFLNEDSEWPSPSDTRDEEDDDD